MEKKPSVFAEYSDRELLERIAVRAKEASDAAIWTKNYIIITSLIAVVLVIIGYLS